jgi:hypothetical protein
MPPLAIGKEELVRLVQATGESIRAAHTRIHGPAEKPSGRAAAALLDSPLAEAA